jgi:hypothetical protein
MHLKRTLVLASFAALAASLTSMGADLTTTLPEQLAAPLGSSTSRGFLVRTVQAPDEATVANNSVRALRQLNGTLVDEAGAPIPNQAVPGPNADGSYTVQTINFEREAAPFDVVNVAAETLTSFTPELFPGIPGTSGSTEKFAAEVIGFLELTVGTHTFGVSVATDRTDVNNDDAYQVFVGANPRNFFATKVGEFERFAPPFTANSHNENRFTVQVTKAGIYPFRIVYWQTGLGANLQFYSVDPATETRVLVNDPNDPSAIKAYRDSNAVEANSPYIAEVSPAPGSDGNSASAPIEALLMDGAATVAASGVSLFLNNVKVTPQTLTKTDKRLAIQYSPNASRPDRNNQVRLEYTDSAGVTRTNSWQFGIRTGGATTTVTGQWDFERGDLSATVGQALQYLDGPNGLTAQGTQFGTTTQLGVADIAGKPARVMRVPGDLSNKIGYIMEHGIAPNGGGTRVNQFTVIMDVFVAESGPGAASLLQISSINNTDDGDLFWQGSNFGQGTDGYKGTGQFTAGAWHRVVAAYDQAASPPVVTKFVDGIKQDDWTANQGLDNPRRALLPQAVLFADGDQDERREMWVSSIQIRSGKLSDAEAVVLGGPTAEGIPQLIPSSNVTGQWDFERGDLSATVGKPLQYLDGADGETQTGTQFGTTTELGVPDIDGKPAKVMRVPGDLSNKIGYIMDHGIAPNGGGTRVNQFTLIMDVLVADSGPGAASLLQISSLNNTDDGDLFWQGGNFGQGSDGYNGTGAFTAGEWHRVAAAYDQAANPPVVTKFVDGIKQDDWTANQGLDNPRRALLPQAVLFADGDQDERREMWVNSVQIRSGKLTDAELISLGGPSADGIPVVLATTPTTSPTISLARQGNSLTISWLAGADGFTLQSSPTLSNPSWTAVSGVANNSVTVPIGSGTLFFRLSR